MKIEKMAGQITTLGESSGGNFFEKDAITYLYIELDEERIVKRFTSSIGVNGHLRTAFENKESVELHVATGGKMPKGTVLLLAIQRKDGRIFGIEPFLNSRIYLFFIVLGLVTLPLFGLGIFSLLGAYSMWKMSSMVTELNTYVAGIPKVILL